MGREERVRQYNLTQAQKDFDISPTESDTALSEASVLPYTGRKIRVVDRFGIILQIFASRAQSQLA